MLVGLIVIFALLTVTLPKSWWLLATEERDSSRYGTLWWQCTGVLTAALLLLGLLVPLNPSESTGSTRNPSPGGPGDLGSAGLILLLLGVAALASYGTLLVLLLKPPLTYGMAAQNAIRWLGFSLVVALLAMAFS